MNRLILFFSSSGPIVALKKFTDPLGHYLYMTIGIIWSLAAKGWLIFLKIPVLWQKNKIRSEPLGPLVRPPPPLSEPPVHKKVLFLAPFPYISRFNKLSETYDLRTVHAELEYIATYSHIILI